MWDVTTRKIVVGVSTSDCLPALQVAAEEAARRRCGVHLLHVVQPVYASHPRIDELDRIAAELHRAGTAVVVDASHALEKLLPEGLRVTTELCHGAVVSTLLEASTRACLLVLQQGTERPQLLSTIQAAAARAECPVLVAPRAWTAADPTRQGLIVAGVEDASRSARVVRAALVEASRRHARLGLLHGVGEHPAGCDSFDQAARDARLRLEQRTLEAQLRDLCATRPGVEVGVEVVPLEPADAIVARSQTAALVVVGRGHHRLPFVRRPGPVTTEVLSRAGCPVLVVQDEPPGPPPRVRGLSEVAIP